jgi:hypothetical protein
VKSRWSSTRAAPAHELVRSTAIPIAIGWGDLFASTPQDGKMVRLVIFVVC